MSASHAVDRSWRIPPIIGTASGGSFHVLDPQDDEVRLGDIAHHLSHIGRYTGACSQLWSVAAHSLEVSRRVAMQGGSFIEQLQGLLHDASEAYLVDIPRPFKPDVYFRRQDAPTMPVHFESYYEVENRVMRSIFRALDVPLPLPQIIGHVDEEMVFDEVANFFGPGFMWDRYDITRSKDNLSFAAGRTPEANYRVFIDRYEELTHLADRYES